jgi:hypothetical protein
MGGAFVSAGWEGESGVDAAAMMLKRFDRTRAEWDLPQTGDYWDAVAEAWRLGRHGEETTVAVIDDGFDLSYEWLADQQTPWGIASRGPQTHGTAVALLLRHVAPRANLVLYPVGTQQGWEPELIERALRDAAAIDCDIVNLSLGRPHEISDVYEMQGWLSTITPWEDLREDDLEFMVKQAEARLNGWRELAKVPDSAIGRAASELARSGRTVIAAAGNSAHHIFEPAFLPGVYAAAFNRGANPDPRSIFDRVRYLPPGFSQSQYTDFGVFQPPGVLGSSFATPLIAGFAALMTDRTQLESYREIERLSGLGSELIAGFVSRQPNIWQVGIERWIHAIDETFTRALALLPHQHTSDEAATLCPECSFFALGAYGNYGMFKLNTGVLGVAFSVLSTARSFAPHNAHLLLLLGRLWALRANSVRRVSTRDEEVVYLLSESAGLLRKGLWLQHFQRDQELLEEVERGLDSPSDWQLPSTYEGFGWDTDSLPELFRTLSLPGPEGSIAG